MAPPIHRTTCADGNARERAREERGCWPRRIPGCRHSRRGGLPPAWCRFGPTTYRRRSCLPCRRCSGRCRVTSTTRCPGEGPTGPRSRGWETSSATPLDEPARRSLHTRRTDGARRRRCGRSIAAHGGGFFDVPERRDARARGRRRRVRRARSGHRRADPSRRPDPLGRPRRGRARRVPAHGRSRSLAGRDRPARDRRRGVGRARVRRVGDGDGVAHVDARSGRRRTCSPTRRSRRRATSSTATRERDACSRTRSCIPTSGRDELDAMDDWRATSRSVGLEGATRCTARRRRRRRPAAGSSTTTRSAFPFLERVDALGPRVVAAHKGLGGPIPDQSVDGRVAARHRAGRRRVPRHQVRRVPLRLRARSRRAGGSVRPGPTRRAASTV